jgi:hypothetical protein
VRKLRNRGLLRSRPRNLRPDDVSTKSFGRPRAFRVAKARSAPIAVGFAEAQ